MRLVKSHPSRLSPFSFFADSLFSDIENSVKNLNEIAKRPKANIIENEDNFQVELNVPGFDKENISIEVLDGTLYIKGENKVENEEKNDNFRLREFEVSTFERSFKLGKKLDHDNIEAHLNNGVLSLTVNKLEEEKPEVKKISIR